MPSIKPPSFLLRMFSMWRSLPANVRGAMLIAVAGIGTTAMFVFVKILTESLHPTQIMFVRNTMLTVVSAPYLLRTPKFWRGAARSPGIVAMRAGFNTAALACLYVALMSLSVAEVQAISFANVLFMVPMAAVFFGERVGPRRWSAALIGFVGVLVTMRPNEGLGIGAIAALGGAFFFAATAMSVKELTRRMTSYDVLLWGTIAPAALTLVPAIIFWRQPTLWQWGLLVVMTVVGSLSQLSYIQALKIADATAVAPADYLKLVFAAIAGYFIFGDLLDWPTVVGAVVIVCSTLYLTYREHQVGREQAAAAAPAVSAGFTSASEGRAPEAKPADRSK